MSSSTKSPPAYRVVAIHGVGNPEVGDIERMVARNVTEGEATDVEVSEFNWNQHVPHPVDSESGQLTLDAYEEVIVCSALASAYEPPEDGDGLLRRAQAWLFRSTQWLFAVGMTILVCLPFPLVYLFFGAMLFGVVPVMWIGPASFALLALGGCCLTLYSVVGLLRIAADGARAFPETARGIVFALLPPTFSALLIPPLLLSGAFRRPLSWGKSLGVPAAFPVGCLLIIVGLACLEAVVTDGPGLGVLLLGTLGAAWLLSWVTRALLGPAIKVILDVIRYVASPAYRRDIQKALDEHLRRRCPPGPVPIVILGHSLGSVLAIDSLLGSRHWTRDHDVCLVTMGSPLGRFFVRFFPALLGHRTIRGMATGIAGRVGTFRWVNVFRPLDQIGGRLELGSTGVREVSSDQWFRFISAHVGYWSDPTVREHVFAGIQQANPVSPPADAHAAHMNGSEGRRATISERRIRFLNALRIDHAYGRAALAAAVLGWALAGWGLWEQRRTADTLRASLAAEGRTVKAEVVYWMTDLVVTAEGSRHWNAHFRFSFDARGGPQAHELATRSDHRRTMTLRNLEKDIRVHYEIDEHLYDEGLRLEYGPVEVRYLPEDPGVFDLPAYPPSGFFWLIDAFLFLFAGKISAIYMIFVGVHFVDVARGQLGFMLGVRRTP